MGCFGLTGSVKRKRQIYLSEVANCLITVSHANSEKKCLLRQLSRIRFQWLLQMLGRSCTPATAIESFVAVKNDLRFDPPSPTHSHHVTSTQSSPSTGT